MAISQYHQQHPEEYTEYNRERTRKWRYENPDKVRKIKENYKEHEAEYRKEHAEEKRIKQNQLNAETLKNATNNGKWTDEEIKQLRQMIVDGLSYKEIAANLKRSYRSVSWAKQKYLPDLVTAYKKVNYLPTDK